MRDQIVKLETLTQKGVLDKQASRNISFLLLGFVLARENRKRRDERRREEKRKRKRRRKKGRRRRRLRYGILVWNCVWNVWILIWRFRLPLFV